MAHSSQQQRSASTTLRLEVPSGSFVLARWQTKKGTEIFIIIIIIIIGMIIIVIIIIIAIITIIISSSYSSRSSSSG